MRKKYFEMNSLCLKAFVLTALFFSFVRTTLSQTEYTWNNTSGGDWTIPENWNPSRINPAVSDILLFNNGGTYNVTNLPSQTIRKIAVTGNTQLTLQATATNDLAINGPSSESNFIVAAGSSLQIGTGTNALSMSFSTTPNQQGAVDGILILGGGGTMRSLIGTNNLSVNGTLSMQVGSTFLGANMSTNISGTLIQNGGSFTTTTGNLMITGNTIYNHTANGGQVPTATWSPNTQLNFTGIVNQNITGLSGQSVGSILYDCPSQTVALIQMSSSTGGTTVNGDYIVANTGSSSNGIELFSTTGSLTVMGNLLVQSGTANINADANNNTINVYGDLIVSNGATFTRSAATSTGTIEFFGIDKNFNASAGTLNTSTMQFTINAAASTILHQNIEVTSGRTITVNGSLNMGSFIINGAGNFVLANTAVASIITAHTGGINRQTIDEGCIQNTGTRTLNNRASFEFNGTTAQVSGDWANANPVVWGNTNTKIVFNNPAGVTLSKGISLSGNNSSVELQNGLLTLAGNDLILSSTTSLNGTFSVSRMIVTNGTGMLKKTLGVSGMSFVYPIGETTEGDDYSPVTFSFSGNSPGSTVGMRVVDAVHPLQMSNPDALSRYWVCSSSVNNPGFSNSTLTATFHYTAADIIGDEENYVVNHYNAGTFYWSTMPTTQGINEISTNVVAATGFLPSNFEVTASAPTPVYYRSATNGNWNELSTWETSTDVNFLAPAPMAASAIPSNTNSNGIFIQTGHNVTVSAAQTADDILVNGTLTIASGITLTVANGTAPFDMIVNGTVVNGNAATTGIITPTGAIQFAAGSTYNHAKPAGTIPVATWDIASTCLITGATTAAPAGLNPTGGFGNFVWNAAEQSAVIGTGNMTTTGSYTIQNTGTSTLAIGTGTSGGTVNVGGNFNMNNGLYSAKAGTTGTSTLNVSGDFNLNSGIFSLTQGTTGSGILNVQGNLNLSASTFNISAASTTGAGTINCFGNYNQNGATLTSTEAGTGISVINLNGTSTAYNYVSGTLDNTRINYGVNASGAVATLNSNIALSPNRTFTIINGGTLMCGTYIVSGGTANTFTLNAGAGLGIGSPDGITTVGNATGNIQTTTRTFNAGARYIYTGSTAQVTGNALPATISGSGLLQIESTANVTLTNVLSITATGTGGLNMVSGRLVLNDNTLTVAANTPSTGNYANSTHIVTNGNGQLIKTYAAGIPAFTFPIGDGTSYSPIIIGFTQNGVGNVGYRVIDAIHPNNGAATDYLTRYFVTTSTIATPYAYNVSFGYAPSDITGNVSNMLLSHWNGSVWTPFGSTINGNVVTGTQALTNINAPLAGGHFTARTGEVNYYRTTANGNWNNAAIWEVDNNQAFSSPAPATEVPTADNCAGAIIQTAHTITYNNAVSISNLAVNGTLTNETFAANTITSTGQIHFNDNAVYRHNRNGGSIPTAVWSSSSLAEFVGVTSTSPSNFVGQTLGNFRWNPSTEQTNVIALYQGTTGAFTMGFTGNFEVVQTGIGALTFINATSASLAANIGGDFVLQSGTFYMNNSTGSSVTTMNLAGNYNQSNGSFLRNLSTGTGTQVLNFANSGDNKTFGTGSGIFNTTGININVNANAILTLNNGIEIVTGRLLTVLNGGALYMQDNIISGAGSFIFNSNVQSRLGIGHAGGIMTDGSAGNVQVTGPKTFGTNSNYIYTGSVAQVTGTALPATINGSSYLMIDNTSSTGVTLTNSCVINGYLNMNDGQLILGNNTLTLANSALPIQGSPFSANNMIVTNGTGQLIRAIPSTSSLQNPYIFPVGTGNDYAPVSLEFNTTSARNLGVRTVAAEHPENGDATDYINRYWSFTNSTVGTMIYSATFQYANSDVVGSESNMEGNIRQANEWYAHSTAIDAGANTFTIPASGYLNHTAPAVGSSLTNTDVTARSNNINLNFHYRTVSNGNWSNPAIWEISTDPLFVNPAPAPASYSPDYSVRTINIVSGHAVTLDIDVTADEVFINDASTSSLTIASGRTLSINATGGNDVTLGGNAQRLIVNGTVSNLGTFNGSNVDRMMVGNGGKFIHARNGGAIPAAAWNANSFLEITGIITTAMTGMNQSFGHVLYNCPSQTIDIATFGMNSTQTWGGNFRILNTGIGSATILSNSSSTTINIQGNLLMEGGVFDVKTGTGTGVVTLNVFGNFHQTGGTFTQTSTASASVISLSGAATTYTVQGGVYTGTSFNYIVPSGANATIASSLTLNASRTLVVNNGGVLNLHANITANGTVTNNGRINTQTYLIDGTGTFNQGSNASNALNAVLSLGSAAGFSSAPIAAGNIQTALRNVNNPSNYIYEATVTNTGNGYTGAATQNSLRFMGCTAVLPTGVTAVFSEFVNANITLGGSLTLTGTSNALTLNNSIVTLGDNNLILYTLGNVINGTFSNTNMIVTNGNGYLFRQIPATAALINPYIFPVGSANEYSPAQLNFATAATGRMGVRVKDQPHPQADLSESHIARYWSFNVPTGLASYSYSASLQYLQSDVVGDEAELSANYWNGTLWNLITANVDTDDNVIYFPVSGVHTQATLPLNGADMTLLGVCAPIAITSQPNNVEICSGAVATFSTSITGTGASYQWQVSTNGGGAWTNVADNNIYSGANTSSLTVENMVIGMSGYLYRVLIQNTCSNEQSTNATLTLTAGPSANAGSNQTICGITSVSINGATGSSPVGFQWTHNGTGTISGATTLTPTYTPTSNDLGSSVVLTLTAQSNNECPSATSTITVTFSEGEMYYQDADGDGFGDVTNATMSCEQPTGYVSNFDDCNDNNNSVWQAVPVDVIIDWTGSQTVCINGTPTTLSGGLPAGGTWSGTGVTGNTFNQTTLAEGDYVITYTVLGDGECLLQGSNTITLTAELCIGVDENTTSPLKAYPSYTTGMVTLTGVNMEEATIMDSHGRVLSTTSIFSDTKVISLAEYAAGVYFIQVKTTEGIQVVRIVKV